MSDEIFRPRKPQPQSPEEENPNLNMSEKMRMDEVNQPDLNMLEKMRIQNRGMEREEPAPATPANVPSGFQVKGQMPEEFMQQLKFQQGGGEAKQGFGGQQQQKRPNISSIGESNDHAKEIVSSLKNQIYEEILLPSKGKFYDGTNGPANGILSLRHMTGEEESILATPRFTKRGQAINMIFKQCIKEGNIYRPENFLTIDRTYLLIYLRIISFTENYDVELKCTECDKKFSTTIRLNELNTNYCPDDFGPNLQDVMPDSKLPFSYRLSTGKDEQDIIDRREDRIRRFGDSVADDTLLYRTALLLNDVDGVTSKDRIQTILKSLPINDLAYIRNCMNEPPFGVETEMEILCPLCMQDFVIDLPIEAGFFFPRKRKGDQTRAFN